MTDMVPFDVSKLHTTQLGVERIRRNLKLALDVDVVQYCKSVIQDRATTFKRKGKNWYFVSGETEITVNASSHTIITAHKM